MEYFGGGPDYFALEEAFGKPLDPEHKEESDSSSDLQT